MKFAVCVPPPRCDVYGHLSRYASQLTETAASRGLSVETLRYETPEFLPRLLALLADEEAAVHFHCYLYDLKISGDTSGRSRAAIDPVHVLDGARAVVLATVSDHPFTDFMQDTIRGAHPSTNFVILDDSFADCMKAMNPRLTAARFDYQPVGPPQNYDPELNKPFEARTYDLVVPIHVVDLSKRNLDVLRAKLGVRWLVDAMTATYETLLKDLSRNPFQILMEHVSCYLGGATFADIQAERAAAAGLIVNAVSAVDGLARQERRHRMVRSLLRDIGGRRVVVLADPVPGLEVDKSVRFIGAQQTPECIRLMADTKVVLNCNPTYPGNLHERVTVGMMYGSCVISDINPYIAQHFSRSQLIPYVPGTSVSLASLFETHDLQAIGAAAARKVHGNRRYSWEGHVDALQALVAGVREGGSGVAKNRCSAPETWGTRAASKDRPASETRPQYEAHPLM